MESARGAESGRTGRILASLVGGGASHLTAAGWAGGGSPSSSLRDPSGPGHQACVSSPFHNRSAEFRFSWKTCTS